MPPHFHRSLSQGRDSQSKTLHTFIFINAVHAHVQWFCNTKGFVTRSLPHERQSCQIATSSVGYCFNNQLKLL